MPSKRKPALSFEQLTCRFAPESRRLADGQATRYMEGKVRLTLSDGADEGVCLVRRKPGGAKWGKRKPQPQPFDKGVIQVNQTPADYESGANYELTAHAIDNGATAKAAIDFPPGAESLGWQGTAAIRAFPLVRTEDAILLWIRADTGIKGGMIDAVASAKGKRRTWQMEKPTPGPCAYLLFAVRQPVARRGAGYRPERGSEKPPGGRRPFSCAIRDPDPDGGDPEGVSDAHRRLVRLRQAQASQCTSRQAGKKGVRRRAYL